MTYAIAMKNPLHILPKGPELQEFIETAKLLGTCPYYQKIGPGGILAIWFVAREMGLPPMMCLNGGLYTFSGQVTLSAQMMNMMIVNAGFRADVIELNERVCHLRFWRSDRPKDNCTFEYKYTIEMAAAAGYLHKDNWKKTPRDMLFSRCLSGGARKYMPDVIMNCYVHGELEDDGHILPVVPDIATKSVETVKKVVELEEAQPTKQIEFQKVEGFEAFQEKHLRADDKLAYVRKIATATNKTENEIINQAIGNEIGFLKAFDKWNAEQQKPEKKMKSKVSNETKTSVPLDPFYDNLNSLDEAVM